MKKLLPLPFILILLVSCSQPEETIVPTTVQTGLEMIADYDFAGADELFKEVMGQDLDSNWAFYGHGLAYEAQLQYYDALNTYSLILERDPDFDPAWSGLARAYAGLDMPLNALDACHETLDQTGATPQTLFELSHAYIGTGQFDLARETSQQAVSAGLNSSLGGVLEARAAFLEGDLESGEEALRVALSGAAPTAEFFMEAADCLEAMGRPDSAMSLSRQAVVIGEAKAGVLVRHLRRALRSQYMYEARELLDQLAAKDTDGLLHNLLQSLYYSANDDALGAINAVMAYRKACHPTFSPVFYELDTRLAAGDNGTAQIILEEAEAMFGKLAYSSRFFQAAEEDMIWGYMGIGIDVMAGSKFEAWTGEYARGSRYQYLRAKLMALAAVPDDYADAVSKVREEEEDSPDWLTRLGDISALKMMPYQETSEGLYRRALEMSPGYVPALKGLLDLLERNHRFADAYTVCEDFSDLVKMYPRLEIRQAVIKARTGRTDDGTRQFLAQVPHVRADLTSWDRILQALQLKQATEFMNEILALLVELNLDNTDALVRAAEWKADLGEYDDALELAEKTLAEQPEYEPARIQKARALFGLGKKKQAFELFETLYAARTGNPDLQLYFSRALATDKRDKARAGNLARGAVVTGRNMLKAWYNMCYVNIQFGEYPQAAGKARQSTQQFPYDPVGFYWLGKASYLAGKEEARGALQKAVELGIYGDYLMEVQQMLEKLD